MTRLIEADAVLKDIEDLRKSPWYNADYLSWQRRIGMKEALDMISACIRHAPTVDAVPVRHGKWIAKSTGGEYFDCCSECGYVEWDAPNKYCPNCGARMDAERVEE